MPTTKKPRSTGYEAGQRQRSKTLRPRKVPEKLGPGLRELEQLVGRQRMKGEHTKTLVKELRYNDPEAKSARALDQAWKSLSNPRPLPKRKQQVYAPTSNYRIVRRNLGKGEYLVISHVEYLNGKPYRFDIVGGAPSTGLNPLPGVRILDAEGIQRLRGKLDEMLTAFAQPILDERDDFGRK